MPFSVRLDPETEVRIRRLAVLTGRSKSDVVRDAVSQYARARQSLTDEEPSAFERLKPFIGAVRTGGAQFSSETHAKYRARLEGKHRGRGPR
jgi:hypothetical protein